jgi:hypothetical protein
VRRPDDPPHYTEEYQAARLDLIRRARQGDPEAIRQRRQEWLDLALRAAAGAYGERAARVARQALRDVPPAILEQHAREQAGAPAE